MCALGRGAAGFFLVLCGVIGIRVANLNDAADGGARGDYPVSRCAVQVGHTSLSAPWRLDNMGVFRYTKRLIFIKNFTCLGGINVWFLGQKERCE